VSEIKDFVKIDYDSTSTQQIQQDDISFRSEINDVFNRDFYDASVNATSTTTQSPLPPPPPQACNSINLSTTFVNDELPAPPDYFFNNTASYFSDLLIQHPVSTATANINYNQQLKPIRPTVAILNNDDISYEAQIIKRKKRNCANILNLYFEYVFLNGYRITKMEKYSLLNNEWINDNIIFCYASLIFDNKTFIMPSPVASNIFINGDFQRNYFKRLQLINYENICAIINVKLSKDVYHWILVYISIINRKLVFADPLGEDFIMENKIFKNWKLVN